MKDKIVKKLTRFSRKYVVFRPIVIVFLFVFLWVCHFFSFFYRERKRMMTLACAVVIFFLSSSFALPILLDINMESGMNSVVYASDLEVMLQNGDLDELLNEEDAQSDVEYQGYEDYDPDMDIYSVDEILEANADYLSQRTQKEEEIGETAYTEDEVTFSSEDWRILLVNKHHPIPENYVFSLATIIGDRKCDERILGDLLAMLQAAKEDGVSLNICSSYRDLSLQQKLFTRKINNYMAKGLNYLDAYKLSSQAVTVPEASEHQIGLSLDINTPSYTSLDEGFGETKAGIWLYEHCQEFGFILRYPKDKEFITSIEYEPWHFRYVGKEAATIIMTEKITLEEFWDNYVE